MPELSQLTFLDNYFRPDGGSIVYNRTRVAYSEYVYNADRTLYCTVDDRTVAQSEHDDRKDIGFFVDITYNFLIKISRTTVRPLNVLHVPTVKSCHVPPCPEERRRHRL